MVLWRKLLLLLLFQELPFPALLQGLQLLWASQVHGQNQDQGQGPGQGHGWSQVLPSGFQVRPQLSSYLSLHSENCIFVVQRLPLSSSEVE
jgi:hypothetical protein